MIFIYNALLEGWTVKKTQQNQFRFSKDLNNNQDILVENYLDKFIKNNMNIKGIFNKN